MPLLAATGDAIKDTYETIGEPTSVDDAAALAASDPYQFQWWAKGNDRGIDGRIYFHDDTSGDTKSVILSVKAGHTGPDQVRDLRGTVEREKAAIGVLITMDKPTAEMRKEAATGEFYLSECRGEPLNTAYRRERRGQPIHPAQSRAELVRGSQGARPGEIDGAHQSGRRHHIAC